MALLLIRLPPRPRLGARSDEAEAGSRLPAELDYVLVGPGGQLASQGCAAPALLPRADGVAAVLADEDVAWHRVTLPRASASRLRAALHGALEESLLDDDESLHFAVAPAAQPGQQAWVAVVQRRWLAGMLAELERHGLAVERVLPASEPAAQATGHFVADPAAPQSAPPTLVLSSEAGVSCVRLSGGLARALLPPADATVRWTAAPAAAAAAEQWLGRPVAVRSEAERLAAAAGSTWNLRQFDLAARHRGARALRGLGAALSGPRWRAFRWGVVTLLIVQLAGLNAWAWQQQRAVAERKEALVTLLREAHPQVRAVLDAPLQMERETARLRAAAGRPGEGDLEILLAAAASAWPAGQGPAQTVGFEPGRLTLGVGAWSPAQVEQFRQALRPSGYAVDSEAGRVIVRRAAAGDSR